MPRVEELELKVSELTKAIEKLTELHDNLTEADVFDDEDLQYISDYKVKIEELKQMHQENLSQLRDELTSKRNRYEKTIKTLEAIVQRRKRIIDDIESRTHVLSENPELLEMFAQKQATLMKSIQKAKDANLATLSKSKKPN